MLNSWLRGLASSSPTVLAAQVQNVIDMPANDKLSLFEASRYIVSRHMPSCHGRLIVILRQQPCCLHSTLRTESSQALKCVVSVERHHYFHPDHCAASGKTYSAVAMVTCLAECRLCNQDIVQRVQQVICFAFHDSRLLLQTCSEAKEQRKIVTLFYLD